MPWETARWLPRTNRGMACPACHHPPPRMARKPCARPKGTVRYIIVLLLFIDTLHRPFPYFKLSLLNFSGSLYSAGSSGERTAIVHLPTYSADLLPSFSVLSMAHIGGRKGHRGNYDSLTGLQAQQEIERCPSPIMRPGLRPVAPEGYREDPEGPAILGMTHVTMLHADRLS